MKTLYQYYAGASETYSLEDNLMNMNFIEKLLCNERSITKNMKLHETQHWIISYYFPTVGVENLHSNQQNSTHKIKRLMRCYG